MKTVISKTHLFIAFDLFENWTIAYFFVNYLPIHFWLFTNLSDTLVIITSGLIYLENLGHFQ